MEGGEEFNAAGEEGGGVAAEAPQPVPGAIDESEADAVAAAGPNHAYEASGRGSDAARAGDDSASGARRGVEAADAPPEDELEAVVMVPVEAVGDVEDRPAAAAPVGAPAPVEEVFGVPVARPARPSGAQRGAPPFLPPSVPMANRALHPARAARARQVPEAVVNREAAGAAQRRRQARLVKSPKDAIGAVTLAAGMLLVLVGVSTQGWIVGTVSGLTVGEDPVPTKSVWAVGLLRTHLVYYEGDAVIKDTTFDNQSAELKAGETTLMLSIVALASVTVGLVCAGMLAVGRLRKVNNLGHGTAIWCSFLSGLLFIVSSITYSAVAPKLPDPLTFGYSFIMVLSAGFMILIAGLIFVLSRQESWNEGR